MLPPSAQPEGIWDTEACLTLCWLGVFGDVYRRFAQSYTIIPFS